MRKVLVANRGEVAVRVMRACRDAGVGSVAIYADPDRDAVHVRMADEAFALGGATAKDSYLDIPKVIRACLASDADAVHPGWGFLAENADFAQAVLDEGLTWIGPAPQVIRDLGDKTAARRIALRAGAPMTVGTPDPVSGVEEVKAFAESHGMPIVIKAAFGGGGCGLKVVRSVEEIAERYESAVREAVASFGRGECFVERYVDRPRHIETQCLADSHGNVVVVSTRDCSLQRRHQKLVEEAPAPFLTDAQLAELYATSKAILTTAGYVGAGTCEFLMGQDGTISFLEVNTRLQVEHPVSEEVTGLDLVREQFRIAEGEALGYGDPEILGHSIEFRINGEDAGRGMLPATGVLTTWRPPAGPGVRLDSGVEQGAVVGVAFDSLLAKLIVTGRTRADALARARRALGEFEADGMATLLPFHRAVVEDQAFAAPDGRFAVHTQWIETEFSADIPPFESCADGREPVAAGRSTVVIAVNQRRMEVTIPTGLSLGGAGAVQPAAARSARRAMKTVAAPGGDAVVSPMQGTVVKIAVRNGQRVAAGDQVVVIEAMKMEQPLMAHKSGTVTGLTVGPATTVPAGTVICELRD